MFGYVVASIVTDVSQGSETCFYIMCWRWPFFIEVGLLIPLCLLINTLPRAHFNLYTSKHLLLGSDPNPGTTSTIRPEYGKLGNLNVTERSHQEVRTDDSYTPSSSSIQRSDPFIESPETVAVSSERESPAAALPGSNGGYQDLSSFPSCHSIDVADRVKSAKDPSVMSNYRGYKVYIHCYVSFLNTFTSILLTILYYYILI